MRDFGRDGVLVTRDAGAQARRDIELRIVGLTPGHPIALDFAGVVAISVPFADEAIGQLLAGWAAGYYDDYPLLAVNADSDTRETVAAALRQRRLALLGIDNGAPELLGGDEVLSATLQEAHRLGTFSAGELAMRLELSPQAANNRLKLLLRSGALRRTRVIPLRGGKEFAYAVPRESFEESVPFPQGAIGQTPKSPPAGPSRRPVARAQRRRREQPAGQS
jgi:hypothetical protein